MIAVLDGDWFGLPARWAMVGVGLLALALFGALNALTNRKYVFTDGLVSGVVGRMGSGKSLFMVLRVLVPFCRALSKRGVVYSATGRPVRRVITNFKFDPGMPRVEVRTVQPTAEVNIFGQLIRLADELGAIEGPWLDADGVLQDGRKPVPQLCDECDALYDECEHVCGTHDQFRREPILNALVMLDEMHFFMESSKLTVDADAGFVISMARKYNAEIWWSSQHEMKVHKRLRDESSVLWLAGKFSGLASFFVGDGLHVARCYASSAQVEKARQNTGQVPRSIERRFYRWRRKHKRLFNSFELLVPNAFRRSEAAKAMVGRRELSIVKDEQAS